MPQTISNLSCATAQPSTLCLPPLSAVAIKKAAAFSSTPTPPCTITHAATHPPLPTSSCPFHTAMVHPARCAMDVRRARCSPAQGNGHDNLLQRRVARALPDAVDGALQLAGARNGTCQRVGRGQAEVVLAVRGDNHLQQGRAQSAGDEAALSGRCAWALPARKDESSRSWTCATQCDSWWSSGTCTGCSLGRGGGRTAPCQLPAPTCVTTSGAPSKRGPGVANSS